MEQADDRDREASGIGFDQDPMCRDVNDSLALSTGSDDAIDEPRQLHAPATFGLGSEMLGHQLLDTDLVQLERAQDAVDVFREPIGASVLHADCLSRVSGEPNGENYVFLLGTYDAALGFVARNVLVADDDATTLSFVAAALQALGTVTCADDGDELIQALAQGPYDLVVTDIQMPWMTGLHVAHCTRTAGLQIPFIVMTALPIAASDVQLLGPRSALLRKPFRIGELLSAANRLLDPEAS